MDPPVTLPELAAALITVFEGERLTAYQDTGGIWTIGIGHTHGITEGMTITEEQAQAFFAEDQAPLFEMVQDRPILEAAALVSFGFNCGYGALSRILAGYSIGVPERYTAMLQFYKDHKGNVLAGLKARRNLEVVLIALSQQQTA